MILVALSPIVFGDVYTCDIGGDFCNCDYECPASQICVSDLSSPFNHFSVYAV